jgi:cell wall-associated NlpC family hydrolase
MKYDDLIGIPFVDGGRDKNGYDCFGLVLELLERQGYDIQDYDISAFDLISINGELTKQQEKWTKLDNPITGCVILLANGCTADANHIGIVIDDYNFIHSYAYSGVCISKIKRWKSHILGYYLPPKIYKRGENS